MSDPLMSWTNVVDDGLFALMVIGIALAIAWVKVTRIREENKRP